MTKSYQSYMGNLNYDVSCKDKYMLKIKHYKCNSMKFITNCMPMIGTSPNIPYLNELVNIVAH